MHLTITPAAHTNEPMVLLHNDGIIKPLFGLSVLEDLRFHSIDTIETIMDMLKQETDRFTKSELVGVAFALSHFTVDQALFGGGEYLSCDLSLRFMYDPQTAIPMVALFDGEEMKHVLFTYEVGMDILDGNTTNLDPIVADILANHDKYTDQETSAIVAAIRNRDIRGESFKPVNSDNTWDELENLAETLDGVLDVTNIELPTITMQLGDNISTAHYDDLITIAADVRASLVSYHIMDLWADHDTQIITFKPL